jgi:hypothetical protein
MFQIPKLRRELSLPYYFPHDGIKIEVPLAFRLKFDNVVVQLKKKQNPNYNEFDYLLRKA